MKRRQLPGILHFISALGYSWRGISHAIRHEDAFRQELAAVVIAAPIGFWLGDSNVERALLVGSLVPVLMMEMVNTAIETVVDRIGEDQNELSGRAKDLGSAAVFFSIVLAVVTWALVLFS
jgi:diacylglycerol kinase (ATP)